MLVDIVQNTISQSSQGDLRQVEEPYSLTLGLQPFRRRRKKGGICQVPYALLVDIEFQAELSIVWIMISIVNTA